MAENNSSAPLKTAEGAYPALPASVADVVCWGDDKPLDLDWGAGARLAGGTSLYTAEQMRAYAAQAVAAQAAPAAVAVPPSAYLNAAGINASDKPGTVVRKLDAAFHDAVTFKDATPALPATDSSAGDLATESVLIEGVAYTIPEPVALELLRLNIELQQAEVQAEPVAQVLGWVHRKNGKIGNHFYTYEPHCDCAVRDDGGEKIAVIAATAPQAQPADALTHAALDVLAERARQIGMEGYDPTADDQYVDSELASAAATYALLATGADGWRVDDHWPWTQDSLKKGEARRMLEKAGALILAEMERLDRAAMAAAQEGGNAAKEA